MRRTIREGKLRKVKAVCPKCGIVQRVTLRVRKDRDDGAPVRMFCSPCTMAMREDK